MPNSPLPLYHKVYLLLRQRLERSQFDSNKPMPGENALATEYSVSRLTIRRSLEMLEAEGLVSRRQGRGTFPVARLALERPQRSSDIESLLAHLSDIGMTTEVQVLEFGYESPVPYIAAQLELASDAQVQKSVRIRRHNGQPFSYLTTYVPADIGKQFNSEALSSVPLLEIFRSIGIRVAGAEQAITALLADPQTAKALDVPLGSPVLSIRRLVRDESGKPVEYLLAVYRPDRYEYRMSMSTQDKPGARTWVPSATSIVH